MPRTCDHSEPWPLTPRPKASECHSAGPGVRIAYEAKLGSWLAEIISRLDLAAHFKILKNIIFQLLHTACSWVKGHSDWGRSLGGMGRAVTFQNSPFLSIHHLVFLLSFLIFCSFYLFLSIFLSILEILTIDYSILNIFLNIDNLQNQNSSPWRSPMSKETSIIPALDRHHSGAMNQSTLLTQHYSLLPSVGHSAVCM